MAFKIGSSEDIRDVDRIHPNAYHEAMEAAATCSYIYYPEMGSETMYLGEFSGGPELKIAFKLSYFLL